MAIDSTQAQIKISLVDDVSKGLSSVQGSFGRLMKTGGMVATAIAGVGSALAVAGGTFAVKTASQLQDLSSAFETLTGSAEKGQALFKELKAMGASTPFEITDLAKSTQTMLAFGMSVDDSKKYLKILGDVSLGNKEKLSGLSLAFAQVQSTGKLMGQDLLQMINQGFNPLNEISKKTGKSIGVLKEEMSEGKISAQMVAEAFETATKEGGLFYQGMEKGSKTLSGTFSTLIDNVKNASAGFIGLSQEGTIVEGSLLSLVQKGINKLNESLSTIDWVGVGNKVNTFITAIGNLVGRISTALIPVKEELVKLLQKLVDWYKQNEQAIMNFINNAGNALVSFIISAVDFGKKLVEQLQNLVVWYQANKFWVDNLVIGLTVFLGVFTSIISAITIGVGIISSLSVVLGILAGAFAFLTSPISLVALAIAGIISLGVLLWRNWDVIKIKAGELGASLSSSFGAMVNYISTKLSELKNNIVGKIENIIQGIKDMGGRIKDALTAPFDSAKTAINNTLEGIKTGASNIKSGVGNFLSNLNPLKSGGNKSIGGIIPGNSFGGDRVMANVNSGEMVLNKTQQRELFNMIKGGNGGGATININNPTVRSDADIQAIAQAVSQVLSQDLQNKRLGV